MSVYSYSSPVKELSGQTQADFEIDFNVIVVIPAYNEARFIGSVVLNVQKFADVVIVVDDGSTDETGPIARAAGAVVVRLPNNRGKGIALNAGFSKALEHSPDVVVTFDGDGQHVSMELPFVIAPIIQGQADIVVGSRYLQNWSKVPRHRVWGHKVFNILTNLASRTKTTDSQSGFRAFSPRALEVLNFRSEGFSVESEMQFLVREHSLRMVEVPITIFYQDKPKRSVIQHGLIVLNGVLRLVGQYRPLLFFGLPGFLLMVTGVGWGAWVVDIYRRAETLAVGYAMISVLFSIVGSLFLATGIILHSVRGLLTELLHDRKTGK